MSLVAGVDSSTQSCKVVIRDAETGELVRQGRAPHPDGTEVDPAAWEAALARAIEQAGGLADVAAAAVAGQQHGMVCLDDSGTVVRPALLWNDTRSAGAAADLVTEFGGAEPGRRFWADAVGSVPVASFTVTKLRWLARHEPAAAERVAAVCLPHDWLTWRLGQGRDLATAGSGGDLAASGSGGDLAALRTDRGDASGTGYWSPATGEYRLDLLEHAFGRTPAVPTVLGPAEVAGRLPSGAPLGAGTGDNAAAALGVSARPGDVIVSIGTSGVVSSVAEVPAADPSGAVAGFADATGRFLPLVCTLNAARVLDAAAAMLRVGLDELAELALRAPAGADGLVLVPYLEGERTPDRPLATGALHGLTLRTATPEHLARAAVEGMLCALADGLDALVAQGARVRRVLLVGGGARSAAVRRIAPAVFGCPVVVPEPGEYVADGAARQAAWVALGGAEPPTWSLATAQEYAADPVPAIRDRYADARDRIVERLAG
ncbi:xylulokinase [Plantactinospora siamensis]|uniref:Xylulose kinase n=1 Tax=Plantactinospora siamensis TaxID=555372 RepID=A0ABV6NXV2_9ACTN